jgi:hypothetical protein
MPYVVNNHLNNFYKTVGPGKKFKINKCRSEKQKYFRLFFVQMKTLLKFLRFLPNFMYLLNYSLCIPSLWFCITKPLFLQKHKCFYTFYGIFYLSLGYKFWAVENLWSSHHVSVVRVQYYVLTNAIELRYPMP